MKLTLSIAVLALAASVPSARAQSGGSAAASGQAQASAAQAPNAHTDAAAHADAYYYFAAGHLYEIQYETTGNSQLAEQAIDSYKKAQELAPDSSTIAERLAEIYAKSQHIRDAVIQAQQALKLDPDNIDAHQLLARIYVRTLGDVNAGDVQTQNLEKAVEQFQAILKLEPNDANSALWLARLYRFQNKHDEAEKVLRAALQHDPDDGPALEQLSQLLIDQGRSQEAIELLKQAAGDTAAPDVYDLLGDAYSQSKDYPNAENAYRKAVENDPDDPGHRHGLAQALMAEEKYDEALTQYQKLAELEPGTAENHLRLAQLYRRMGKFDQAQASLQRAKQLEPGSLQVLYNQALLDEDQARYDDAIKVLNDAIAGIKNQSSTEENPNALAILYEQLGHAYSQQGNSAAAIQTYQDMSKLGPEAAKRAQMLLIDAYREGHDLDGAIAETKKALEAAPKDSSLTVTLAMLYGEKTETDTATKLLNGLLQGKRGDQEIYLDLAQVQERGRKFPEAEQSANKALEMAEEPAEKAQAWFMLGAIYEREKKFDQAEQEFQKALQVNPNNAPVLNYYGYMLADRGIRLPEATALIERAVTQDPANGAYLDSLGWAYYKQNKLTEAEDNLRKAVAREANDPTILSHLGDIYMKQGKTELAAETWEKALSEWQKASPADYEVDKVNELDAQLKTVKKRLAEKSSPDAPKPQ
ncbi:MAG: tetratricopeptide repeat protein [Candidatus Acidiferrales bacterium]